MKYSDFDDIRPFSESEIPDAMHRIAQNSLLSPVFQYLFPDASLANFKEKLCSLTSIDAFQKNIVREVVLKILEKNQSEVILSGFEYLSKKTSFVFVSNHRDILLDSALFQLGLVDNGFPSSEITFGSNLMTSDFIVDFGKSNKMFRVERSTSSKAFLQHSTHLSNYIHYTLFEKKESIWIAQRNGRTKDGNDRTEPALLKMLTLSFDSTVDFVEQFSNLNLTPIAISYEFEPCDFLKTKEIYLSKDKPYTKAENEDVVSILTGITQKKGRIRLKVLPPITDFLKTISYSNKNDFLKTVSQHIDDQIHRNYELFPNNYIAWDIINNSDQFVHTKYSEFQKQHFIHYCSERIASIEGDKDELLAIFLKIYANPVSNFLSL